jgi:hypothetical protein
LKRSQFIRVRWLCRLNVWRQGRQTPCWRCGRLAFAKLMLGPHGCHNYHWDTTPVVVVPRPMIAPLVALVVVVEPSACLTPGASLNIGDHHQHVSGCGRRARQHSVVYRRCRLSNGRLGSPREAASSGALLSKKSLDNPQRRAAGRPGRLRCLLFCLRLFGRRARGLPSTRSALSYRFGAVSLHKGLRYRNG